MAELGAGKGGGYGIAAEGHSIIFGDGLFVTGRNCIADNRDINIGLTDE